MIYIITDNDKELIRRGSIDYKYRLYIMKDKTVIDMITGIQSIGNYNIDGDSSVRRTCNLSFIIDDEGIED